MNDFLLILQMKQGNEKAFDKFVRKYYAGILSYCRYHCMNQAEAEDGIYEGLAEAGSNGEYCGGTELVVNTNRMISQNRGMQ